MLFLASLVLVLHLLWIVWVILGAFWTRGRASLTTFHILSLVWGIAVELSPLQCPLTITEQILEQKAGAETYHGAFLAHLLDRLVYPNLPAAFLVGAGVFVCGINLGIYLYRYQKSRL